MMSLVCNCNCHVFCLTKLRRRKVILIEIQMLFFASYEHEMHEKKRNMSRLQCENAVK